MVTLNFMRNIHKHSDETEVVSSYMSETHFIFGLLYGDYKYHKISVLRVLIYNSFVPPG